jgi:integrase/recombinase XerD
MKVNQTTMNRFAQYCCARLGLGDTTIGNYLSTLRRLLPALGMRPSIDAVEKHIVSMRQTGKSQSHIVNTSIALERYCAFQKIPLRLGRPLKQVKLIRGTLSEAQITLLLASARSLRQRAVLSLLAYSGMRNGELCKLTIGDVDLTRQLVHIHGTKAGKDRYASISPACDAVLAKYLQERNATTADAPLFLTARNRLPLETQDLRKMVRTCAARAKLGKRVYPHLLRHSLATNMLHRGANILAIKEQLGHAFIETTMIYLHASPERMQAEYRLFAPSYL